MYEYCACCVVAYELQAEIEGFRMLMNNAAGVINQNQFFHSLGINNPKDASRSDP